MKTPFKELRPEADRDPADQPRHKNPDCWTTPKTLSSTAKKDADASFASPPPRRHRRDKSPPSEFNKKTNYHFRNGIVRSQQEYFELI